MIGTHGGVHVFAWCEPTDSVCLGPARRDSRNSWGIIGTLDVIPLVKLFTIAAKGGEKRRAELGAKLERLKNLVASR